MLRGGRTRLRRLSHPRDAVGVRCAHLGRWNRRKLVPRVEQVHIGVTLRIPTAALVFCPVPQRSSKTDDAFWETSVPEEDDNLRSPEGTPGSDVHEAPTGAQGNPLADGFDESALILLMRQHRRESRRDDD